MSKIKRPKERGIRMVQGFKRAVFTLTIFTALISASSFSAFAGGSNEPRWGWGMDQNPDAWSVAYGAHVDLVNNLRSGDMPAAVKMAADQLMKTSVEKLNEAGYSQDAAELQLNWDLIKATGMMDVGALDVGDHEPLFKFFETWYLKMKDRFGNVFNMIPLLDDLNTLNFVIPVVFQPKGSQRTGETWDKIEYRKHFIPFSGIVTYWASYGACLYVAKSQPAIKRYCKNISSFLKTGMQNFLAPRLSDFVYDKANGTSNVTIYSVDFESLTDSYQRYQY